MVNDAGPYLIQCISRSGGDVVWWKPARHGYTTGVEKAGRYSKEEAEKIVQEEQGGEIAVPLSTVQSLVHLVVGAGTLAWHVANEEFVKANNVIEYKEEEEMSSHYERRTWKEFYDNGLLWWVNRALHLFGWVIVVAEEEDGSVSEAYPARTTYRGFSEDDEAKGFVRLTSHLKSEVAKLWSDVNDG